MAQTSTIINFIKIWLPFTSLTKNQQRLIIECIETKNDKQLDLDCTELFHLISSFCHLDNYHQNATVYNKLEEIIQLKIQDILQKLKLNKVYSSADCAIMGFIFAFNFFKTCCENTNTLILEKNHDILTLIEFLDDLAQLIFHQLNILETLQGICYGLDINKIKHVAIKLISAIVKVDDSIFCLKSIEFAKTLKWTDYRNDSSFIKNKQFFKKSLTIKHIFVVSPNYSALFKLCLSKPSLFITPSVTYLATKFPPFACSTVKQHRNRPHTICTDEFYTSLFSLSQVKMSLSHELLEKQWNLAELDMKASIDLIVSHKYKPNCSDLIQILESVLGIIQITSKNITKNIIKVNFIKEKVKNHTQDNKFLENKSSEINLKQELEYSQELINLKKKWDSIITSSIYEDRERIIFQKIFSKFYQYYIFKKFIEYVKTNNLNSWYFLTYADFRGRFYYDSVASPQSFWGFRHIYKCDNTGFFEEEYFRCIGVLFKKEIVNADGEFQLNKLVPLGQDKYTTLGKLTTTQLYQELKDLTQIAEFIYYKHALETPNETYFVWVDTTCSMAQHGVKLRGFKKDTLKYVNLDNSNIAYDTYTIYIRELKKFLKKSGWADDKLKLLTRGLLKHVIMTVGYGVTYYTAYHRHKRIAAELFSDPEVFKWITGKEVFKEIYKALTDGQIDELLYLDTKRDWICKQKIDETFNLPDIKLPQYYLVASVKLTNLELNPIGEKRQHHQVSVHLDYNCDPEFYIKNIKDEQFYDKEKTERALYVNAVHALDAYYMRNIIREAIERGCQIIAVHDGFAIPPHQRKWLISIANMVFNKPNSPFSYSDSILI